MVEPYIGEIRLLSYDYTPPGWAKCDGQLLPVNQNQALFSVLGTLYGGDGTTTFALPDLRGRIPMHFGGFFVQGKHGGQTTHTLIPTEMPPHNQRLQASANNAASHDPTGQVFAKSAIPLYAASPDGSLKLMHTAAVSWAGQSQALAEGDPQFVAAGAKIHLRGVIPAGKEGYPRMAMTVIVDFVPFHDGPVDRLAVRKSRGAPYRRTGLLHRADRCRVWIESAGPVRGCFGKGPWNRGVGNGLSFRPGMPQRDGEAAPGFLCHALGSRDSGILDQPALVPCPANRSKRKKMDVPQPSPHGVRAGGISLSPAGHRLRA